MLDSFETEFNWNYKVPKGVNFVLKNVPGCPICQHEEYNTWSAPYFIANVPSDRLIAAAKEFKLVLKDEHIKEHAHHVKATPLIDGDIRTKAIDTMKLIESDLPEQINEKQLLESNLKTLWGRRLYLEKSGQQDTKEYMDTINAIEKHIALKLKLKGEIDDSKVNISLADVIKLPEVGKDGPEPESS
jgi:hypothetical protein